MRNKICILMSLLMLFLAGTAFAQETQPASPVEDFVASLIQNIQTVEWEKLPDEIRTRIDQINWDDFQEKLRNVDWDGILQSIQSFFTETEWEKVGSQIVDLLDQAKQLGLSGLAQVQDYFSHLDYEEFSRSLSESITDIMKGIGDFFSNLELPSPGN